MEEYDCEQKQHVMSRVRQLKARVPSPSLSYPATLEAMCGENRIMKWQEPGFLSLSEEVSPCQMAPDLV